MSQLSRNWHKREIKIGTSVNFCLIERVRFEAQACFLGPDSERFTNPEGLPGAASTTGLAPTDWLVHDCACFIYKAHTTLHT